jgi:hypothetical protein
MWMLICSCSILAAFRKIWHSTTSQQPGSCQDLRNPALEPRVPPWCITSWYKRPSTAKVYGLGSSSRTTPAQHSMVSDHGPPYFVETIHDPAPYKERYHHQSITSHIDPFYRKRCFEELRLHEHDADRYTAMHSSGSSQNLEAKSR